MDTPTLIAIIAAVFTLLGAMLGAIISSVVGYYALKKQDERRFQQVQEEQKKLELKRKITAYRRLEGITEQVLNRSKVGEPVRQLSSAEYETIQSTIAQDHDVLDKSTVAAWDTRGIVKIQYEMGNFSVMILCEAFWPDVKKHYDAIKFSAIPPTE